MKSKNTNDYSNFMNYMGFTVPAKKQHSNLLHIVIYSILAIIIVLLVVFVIYLQNENSTQDSKIIALNTELSQIYNQQQTLTENISKLENTVSDKNEKISKLNAEISDYKSELQSTENQLDNLYEIITPIAKEFSPETFEELNVFAHQYMAVDILEIILKKIEAKETIFAKDIIYATQKTFWIGSTKQQVREAMGAPDRIETTDHYSTTQLNHSEWYYGTSRIDFNGYGIVIGYEVGNRKLNVN